MKLDLGCAEFCMPGTMEEKLRACIRYGLWLELANTGDRDLSILSSWNVEVRTVQAFLLHDHGLAGQGRAERRRAEEHVSSSVDMACEVGAGYVLVVPGYGHSYSTDAEENLTNAFRRLAGYASDKDVTILVEALSPRKSSLLPSLAALETFLAQLNLENLGLAADTCHAFEAGENVLDFREIIEELHLKDTNALPPGMGELDFQKILGKPWKNICLEYRGNSRELEAVLKFLRSLG